MYIFCSWVQKEKDRSDIWLEEGARDGDEPFRVGCTLPGLGREEAYIGGKQFMEGLGPPHPQTKAKTSD